MQIFVRINGRIDGYLRLFHTKTTEFIWMTFATRIVCGIDPGILYENKCNRSININK